MTELPEGFHPDDVWHVVLDALDAHRATRSPHEAYDVGLDPATDPKVTADGYRAVLELAHAYATDRLDYSDPELRGIIDGAEEVMPDALALPPES